MSAPELDSGRTVRTRGARIAGLVACIPANVIDNSFFARRFDETTVADVAKMTGVQSRRWVRDRQSCVDLCLAAGERLLAGLGWNGDSVDALIFVSQTPDHRLPASSFKLHRSLTLRSSAIVFDVNLGCSGYPYGLWLAMTMIQSQAARRVLLAVGDTISRIVDPEDRATAMLFGDAGSMTAIEAVDSESDAVFVLGSDGTGVESLIVPAGGFKGVDDLREGTNLKRDPACLYMDGGEIFNFTLRRIPPLVAQTLDSAGHPIDAYDAFLFHQANLFMLKHLIKKAKLPSERVPTNIERFGNTSCASIPLLLASELPEQLSRSSVRVAMFGFGVGFSWASAALAAGPLQVVELIEQ